MQSLLKKIYFILILTLVFPLHSMAVGKDASPSVSTNATNKKFIICLDAGHGGKDPGAVGSKNTNREKDINLDIIKEVKRLLKVNCSDVKIVCTRETDVFIELGRRAEIANKAKSNLFISVHVNAIPRSASRKPRGVQSYTLTLRTAGTNLEIEKRENSVISLEADGKYKEMYANSNSSESHIMYELMQQETMKESVAFAKLAQTEMVNTGGRQDMGVLQANLAVLRLTSMPAALLEVGYISTEDEEEFLMTTAGRNKMARSIYNAIIKYKAKVTGRQSTLMPPETDEEPVTIETEDIKTTTPPPPVRPAGKNETKKDSGQSTKSNPKTETPKNEAKSTSVLSDAPVFKIQIGVSSMDLKETDAQFKGYKVEKVKDGARFRYYHGATNDYNEIKKIKNDIKDIFQGCYIVAFKNNQIVDVNAAIEEWKSNNKK